MKLLFVDHETVLGGGQVMAKRLLPELALRGFPFDVLANCPDLDGAPVPSTLRALGRAMRGYDLVYANTPRAAIAAALARRPFVWHKHQGRSTWVQRHLVAARARRVLSVVRYGAPRGAHVRIVPNGVPEQDAPPATDLPEGPKILLLGRVAREKGHDVAVRAIDRMRTRATLVVAGAGEWRLPDHPRVLRLGPRPDVASLLAACDALVCPSRVPEGAPLVILEAQRAGVPVVASSVGGIPEIVRDGETAFLVPKESADDLAHALDHALAVDRRAWSRAARRWSRRFTLDACADAVAAVLRECVSPAATPSTR